MSASKLDAKDGQVCRDFPLRLACDNVDEAAKVIGMGRAALKISVYPWGAEFDVVESDAGSNSQEED
jgi:hypothetical protein